ncbi:MAG TPA: integrin alpha, partial [Polyangiaceae bacterium]|nr:integrin alpha [Polyangiaceae bacterium]
ATFRHFSFQRRSPPYHVDASGGLITGGLTGLSVAAGPVPTDRGGAVVLAADGSFDYTPSGGTGFWGDDRFTYAVGSSMARTRLTVQPGTIVLDDILAGNGNGFALSGSSVGDGAGTSVSAAGDVNGDGYADLIIGAPGVASGAGSAYVVFGHASGAPLTLGAAQTQGFTIYSELGMAAGTSVAGVGDVNGDGLDDLLVGAPSDVDIAQAGGAAYVVFGKADTASVSLTTIQNGQGGGYAIRGTTMGQQIGTSVAAAGDVNGDGLRDVIVGSAVGATYVVFGKASPSSISVWDPAQEVADGFALSSANLSVSAGAKVSGAGDVDGDGLDDVFVGASAAPAGGGGVAFVVFGKATTEPVSLSDVQAGQARGFSINAADGANVSDLSVSGAGDVDGDGLADVIIGLPQASPRGVTGAGTAYVVFGKGNSTAVALADLDAGSSEGFVISGANEFDNVAHSVAGAGDLDGDGFGDLVIGSTNAAIGGSASHGALFVVFGARTPVSLSVGALATDSTLGFAALGASNVEKLGTSVAGGADINGDGLLDLVAGAIDLGNSTSGTGYALFGWNERDPGLSDRDEALIASAQHHTLTYGGQALISISGASGKDTLSFAASGLTLDLRAQVPRAESIEFIDLGTAGNNALVLDDAAVRRLPQRGSDAPSGLVKTLAVSGDATDTVRMDMTGYTQVATNGTFKVYRRDGALYGLEVGSDVQLSAP